MESTEQELSKKLAIWAGWKESNDLWYAPNSNYYAYSDLPFTQSLDACFKWLVPKLSIPIIKFEFDAECDGTPLYWAFIDIRDLKDKVVDSAFSCGNSYSMALCNAIEQLIIIVRQRSTINSMRNTICNTKEICP